MAFEESNNEIEIFLHKIASEPEVRNFSPKGLNCELHSEEATAEITYYILQYLTYRNCPNKAISVIARSLLDLIQEKCRQSHKICGYDKLTDSYKTIYLKNYSFQLIREFCENVQEVRHFNELLTTCNSLTEVPTCVFGSHENGYDFSEDRYLYISDLYHLYGVDNSNKISLYAVFDGHEGFHSATYTVSRLPMQIAKHHKLSDNPILALNQVLQAIDAKLCNEKEESGTSVTIVLHKVAEKKLFISWVGNSKAIIIRDGQIRELVKCHTHENIEERKRIEQNNGMFLQMRDKSFRLNGKIPVTRAIGDYFDKDNILPIPDSIVVNIHEKDDFLVIATDGLWNFTPPEEVALALYTEFHHSKGSMSNVIDNLTKLAIKNGSIDDVTIIVVLLRDPALVSRFKWLFEKDNSAESKPSKREKNQDEEIDLQRDCKRRKSDDDKNNSEAQPHRNDILEHLHDGESVLDLSKTDNGADNKCDNRLEEIPNMKEPQTLEKKPADDRFVKPFSISAAEQDHVISQSPQKCSNVMDEIEVPSENEFHVEISRCPSQIDSAAEFSDLFFKDETNKKTEDASVNSGETQVKVENYKHNTHDFLNKIQNLQITDDELDNDSRNSDKTVLDINPKSEHQVESTGSRTEELANVENVECKSKLNTSSDLRNNLVMQTDDYELDSKSINSDKIALEKNAKSEHQTESTVPKKKKLETVENVEGKSNQKTSSEKKNNLVRTKIGANIPGRSPDIKNKTLTPPSTKKGKIEIKPSTGAIPRRTISKIDSSKSGQPCNIRTNSIAIKKSPTPPVSSNTKSRPSVKVITKMSPGTKSTTPLNKSISTTAAESTLSPTLRKTVTKTNSPNITERVNVGKKSVSWKSPSKAVSNVAPSNTTSKIITRRSPAKPDTSVPIANEKTFIKTSSKKPTKPHSAASDPKKAISSNTGKVALRKSIEKPGNSLNGASSNITNEVSLRKSPARSVNEATTSKDNKSSDKEIKNNKN